VSQLDVKNAFLNGILDETEIYMQQPEGKNDGTGRACKLLKSLYGLKQAPLVWYYHIEQYLVSQGWDVCDSDWSLFHKKTAEGRVWLLLYVDDILIFSSDKKLVEQAEKTLIDKYTMHREDLSKYLGLNVHIQEGCAQLSLDAYTTKLRAKGYPLSKRSTLQPIGTDPNAESAGAPPTPQETHMFQSMVGSLMFAASTVRVDLQLACSKLAQGNKKPSLLTGNRLPRQCASCTARQTIS